MDGIRFTQFLRPNGRQVDAYISRPDEIEEIARGLRRQGCEFHTEQLQTGQVNLTVHRDGQDIAGRVVDNGPPVPEAVDEIIREAAERLSYVPSPAEQARAER